MWDSHRLSIAVYEWTPMKRKIIIWSFVFIVIFLQFIRHAHAGDNGLLKEYKEESERGCTAVKGFFQKISAPFSVEESTGEIEMALWGERYSREGCQVAFSSAYPKTGPSPQEKLMKLFVNDSWTPIDTYYFKGPNLTKFGYFKNGAFCVSKVKNDAGEIKVAPPTKFEIHVTCIGGSLETIVR